MLAPRLTALGLINPCLGINKPEIYVTVPFVKTDTFKIMHP
jgi:hypothetical protein